MIRFMPPTLMLIVSSCLLIIFLVHSRAQRPLQPLSNEDRLVFSEDFSQTDSLEHFTQGEPDLDHEAGEKGQAAWSIKDGRLHASKAHNAALWLKTKLPQGDVRVTFKVWAHSDEGDVKCEFLGDGKHHQSGYILINGGWKNSVRAIARQDEHGEDRHNDHACKNSPARHCITKDKEETWVIERIGGTVYWYIDEALALTYRDPHPLQGRSFAFNNWSAPSSFDDLKVYRLHGE